MPNESSSLWSIPEPRTPLVGRAREIVAGGNYLLEQARPLLTLTGPGGVGKTRLALAIAHAHAASFSSGAVFVDLAPIADPEQVPAAIARALSIRQAEDRPVIGQLVAFLRPLQLLLVLDNLEQVLAASDSIAALLQSCPALQILATSRAPLRIRGEQVLRVPPLALPNPNDERGPGALGEADAVVFFLQRARASDSDFPATGPHLAAISEICRQLDGLPLAIELAAAKTRVLSPAALLEHLRDGLQVLAGGARDAPDRQRSLTETITWSYDLLSAPEQSLFRSLAIFSGGATLAAISSVTGGDAGDVLENLTALIDQSLVRRTESATGQPRFAMLETIHAFAVERLESSKESVVRRQVHAEYFLEFAEFCSAQLQGPDQKVWLDLLEDEHQNFRSALTFFQKSEEVEAELRLASALWGLWYYHGPVLEGVSNLVEPLSRARHADPIVRAIAHNIATLLAWTMGETELALEHGTRALSLVSAAANPVETAYVLYHLSLALAWDREAWDEAIPMAREAVELAIAVGPERAGWLAQTALGDLGTMMALRGDREQGVALIKEALAQHRSLGHHYGCAIRLAELALIDQLDHNSTLAAEQYAESLQLLQRIGDAMSVAQPMTGIVGLAAEQSRHQEAARLLGMLEAIRDRVGVSSNHGPPAVWYPVRAQGEALARAAQSETEFMAAFEAGRRLSLADSVTEAIALAESIAAGSTHSGLPQDPKVSAAHAGAHSLTARETDVLRLLAQRWTDTEIAEALFVSPRTVNAHVRSIFDKLAVANRREAAAAAVRHGLV